MTYFFRIPAITPHSRCIAATATAWILALTAIMCVPRAAAQDIFNAANVRIVNPGAPLNHEGVDYAPIISPDGKTLFFTSNRAGSRRTLKGDAFSHDFWSSTKASRLDTIFTVPINLDTLARTVDNGLNTALNEGVMTISPNRRLLFFTGCFRPDVLRKKRKATDASTHYECDIYVVELKPNGEWGIPQNLGKNINSEDWDGHPSLSPSGDRLYFASERPGGYGEADIWYSDYDAQARTWKPAKNLGKPVNTAFRDWSPFIAANNRELYFASDGHTPNYGGTDFYVSVRDAKEKWSSPRNLGKPINTDSNEAFISMPAQRDVIYFSSARRDIQGTQGSYDVFMAFVPRNSLSLAATLTGSVFDACSGTATTAVITVYNPLTKRIVRDTLDAKKRTAFETVINDYDFGSLEKPVDTLSIQIFAENAQFGRLYKELRIKRPQANAQGVFEPLEIPPVQLQFGAKPEFAATLAQPDPTALGRKILAKQMESGFSGLAMEEVVSVSVNRILNYLFFEPNSAAIPPRYVLFKTPEEAAAFSEEKLRGETLDKYYHTLNVFGARLRDNPKSTITIVGCVDDTELKSGAAKKQSLAKTRAQAVFSYLKTVWGIADKRMRLVSRDLPAIPSNREDSLGAAENRRVEIVCDDWEIVKPVVDRSPLIFTSAPTMTFKLPPMPPEALQAQQALTITQKNTQNILQGNANAFKRRIIITRAGKLWRTIELSATTSTLAWNWKNEAGEFPEAGSTPLEIRLGVHDKAGRECLSDVQTVAVRRITTEDKKRATSADDKTSNKTLERYNLIMFPFDKSDIGPMNARILKEYVLPRLLGTSEATIVGHTDVIGDEQYNKTLSESRGGNAKEELVKLAKSKYKSLESRGVGEAEPLFDNSLPEGRFYNRTVQALIETPVADVEQQ